MQLNGYETAFDNPAFQAGETPSSQPTQSQVYSPPIIVSFHVPDTALPSKSHMPVGERDCQGESIGQGAREERSTSVHYVHTAPAVSQMPVMNPSLPAMFTPTSGVVSMPASSSLGGIDPNLLALL